MFPRVNVFLSNDGVYRYTIENEEIIPQQTPEVDSQPIPESNVQTIPESKVQTIPETDPSESEPAEALKSMLAIQFEDELEDTARVDPLPGDIDGSKTPERSSTQAIDDMDLIERTLALEIEPNQNNLIVEEENTETGSLNDPKVETDKTSENKLALDSTHKFRSRHSLDDKTTLQFISELEIKCLSESMPDLNKRIVTISTIRPFVRGSRKFSDEQLRAMIRSRSTNVNPLFEALKTGHPDLLLILLKLGSPLDIRNRDGFYPVHLAAHNGSVQLLQVLYDWGANIEARDRSGFTALHRASFKGREEVVSWLLGHGSDVKSANSAGWTPLHLAAQAGHSGVIRILLDSGADINVKDIDGWTPLYLANLYNRPHIIKYLKSIQSD